MNFPQLFFFINHKISNYSTHICEPRGTYVSSLHICEPALFPLLISAVQHISEKHPETCTREDSNIRTSSRRGNLTLSCIITRRSATLVTSLTIMSVSYRDPLSRQVAEGVLITRCREEILNSKSEFRQPPIVSVRRKVNTGV